MEENEKVVVRIFNSSTDINNYLKLNKNELDFLDWLNKNNYLDYYTEYDMEDSIPEIIEF